MPVTKARTLDLWRDLESKKPMWFTPLQSPNNHPGSQEFRMRSTTRSEVFSKRTLWVRTAWYSETTTNMERRLPLVVPPSSIPKTSFRDIFGTLPCTETCLLDEHIFDCWTDALYRKDVTAALMPPSYLRHIECIANFRTCVDCPDHNHLSISSWVSLSPFWRSSLV